MVVSLLLRPASFTMNGLSGPLLLLLVFILLLLLLEVEVLIAEDEEDGK